MTSRVHAVLRCIRSNALSHTVVEQLLLELPQSYKHAQGLR